VAIAEEEPDRVTFAADPLTFPEMLYVVTIAVAVKFTPDLEALLIDTEAEEGEKE